MHRVVALHVHTELAQRQSGALFRYDVKYFCLTEEVERKPGCLRTEEDIGSPCVAVECIGIWKNTRGEGGCLVCN